MGKIEKIGIIGGTFNPVHNAHIYIAEKFVELINIDKCYFVPAFISPFKQEDESVINGISPIHRIEMLEKALSGYTQFEIDTFEIKNEGISYSYFTLKHFIKKFPDTNLYFLIGEDQAVDFKKWKNWEWIIDSVQLCIVKRYTDSLNDKEKITKELTSNNKEPIWLHIPEMDISSSNIRGMLKEGLSIEHLVPEAVAEYIVGNGLYL